MPLQDALIMNSHPLAGPLTAGLVLAAYLTAHDSMAFLVCA